MPQDALLKVRCEKALKVALKQLANARHTDLSEFVRQELYRLVGVPPPTPDDSAKVISLEATRISPKDGETPRAKKKSRRRGAYLAILPFAAAAISRLCIPAAVAHPTAHGKIAIVAAIAAGLIHEAA